MSTQRLEHVASAKLVDGEVISLRKLALADAADVVRLYESLSDEECYYRFFTAHPAHLRISALLLTEPSDSQYALGAFGSGKLLGVASFYIEIATPGRAEVAVVVAHSEHLRGVGTALLRRLGKIAKDSGVHHLVAEVLAENHPMHRVLNDSGWPCTRHVDRSVSHVDIDLDAVVTE
ncbi:MAG TPA: GNAT family N-acetyltransferase [Mycobacterium sp.]